MQRPLLSFQLTSTLLFLFSSKSHVHIGQYLPKITGIIMPEPHQRWFWHPALYIAALKLSNKQHHLFARSQFVQRNKSTMYHPTSFDCHQSSLLVVGCNCCKHASSLDNHSCGRLTAQLLKRREGDVWVNLMLPGTCLNKTMLAKDFHPSSSVAIYTYMLLFFQNLRKLWRFMSVPNVSLEFSRLHKAFCIEP